MPTYNEHEVRRKTGDNTCWCDVLAFWSELVAHNMRVKEWLVFLCNGVGVFSVGVAWQPVAGPVRIRRVTLVEGDIKLQYRRPTVRTKHGIEEGFAGFMPKCYRRLAISQYLAFSGRCVTGLQGVV